MSRRIEVAEEVNPWSVFILEDGTKIRVRTVLVAVTRTGETLADGQPSHDLSFQQIIEQIRPDQTHWLGKNLRARAVTPNEAYHEMRDIARAHRDDSAKAITEAQRLLCRIARQSGFYRCAEIFEEIIEPA